MGNTKSFESDNNVVEDKMHYLRTREIDCDLLSTSADYDPTKYQDKNVIEDYMPSIQQFSINNKLYTYKIYKIKKSVDFACNCPKNKDHHQYKLHTRTEQKIETIADAVTTIAYIAGTIYVIKWLCN